jgi:hypothetical protein
VAQDQHGEYDQELSDELNSRLRAARTARRSGDAVGHRENIIAAQQLATKAGIRRP